jgi:hypothetical protein
MIKKQKNIHYVNNKEFHEALIVYKTKCNIAKEKGEPKPQISTYLGDCFLKIATHLSYRPNFVNYMFRDDMISDGVENCLHRSTIIPTIEYGPVEIQTLVEQEVTVRCKDGKWRKAFVKSYGTQMLYEYGFASYNVPADEVFLKVVATENHRWFVQSRRNPRRGLDKENVVVDDLRIGDCLENSPPEANLDKNGVLHGLLYGDGSGHKDVVYGSPVAITQGSKYARIRVCKQDVVQAEIQELLQDFGYRPTYPKSANGDPCYYLGRLPYVKDLPFTTDPEYIAGFIYGWWLADGSKTTYSKRLQISTSNENAAQWLLEYSCYAGYIPISHRVKPRCEGDGSYENGLPLHIITIAKPEEYEAKVRYIKEYGEDEVFCLEEPVTNSFVMGNGLLTGNCLQYIHNFDVERTNPFAYFTQIVYYAFLRRIGKEKKQVEIKEKILERTSFDEVFTADEHFSSSDYNSIKDAVYSKYY